MDTAIYGLGAAAIVALLTQVAKALNLPVSAAPWFTLVCSVIAMLVGLLVKWIPDANYYVEAVIAMLTVFLGATGLYHVTKNSATTVGISTGIAKNPS